MIAFISLFLPAVLSVWILEILSKLSLRKRLWFYLFCLNTMLINLICFATKKWILHTADAVIFSFSADMTPSVACNYLIMSIPLAAMIALAEHLLCKHFPNLRNWKKPTLRQCLSACKKAWPKIWSALLVVLVSLLVILAFLAFYSAKWYANTYGQLGFDSILYTLLSDLGGVESDLVNAYLRTALTPALYWSIPICFLLFFPFKKHITVRLFKKQIPLLPAKRVIAFCLCFVIFFSLIIPAAINVELFEYIKYISSSSTIYQDEYVNPATASITFPEQKRNLIYIFLESMETTYFSKEQGGFLETSAAPELYNLAESNINFSPNDGVGGLFCSFGSSWTIGAMVAQTAGIPLKTPPGVDGNKYGENEDFLPGVTSITDILHDNGYHQTLMVGSDPTFGGRQQYYTSHGLDSLYSIFTAWSEGFVAGDYYEWWGIEDRLLFDYAKQKLPGIAAENQPFALTLLTTDTHHIDGYLCPDCIKTSDIQYENVISCSSRKVVEFVEWVQKQDFYENTTIIIVGDHLTMDNGYIQSVGAEEFDRRVYNCFINCAADPSSTRNRVAFTVDMFPTTLGALGCTIEGNRLGLGTNLFSDTPTLGEKLGSDKFNEELGKSSQYYTSNFFFAQ